MEIPPEVIAAKDELAGPLLAAGLITGVDFGVRDEEAIDPEDVALRIFVADLSSIPAEVEAARALFPFPTVVIQRSFKITLDQLPHRPVVGGVSVASTRLLAGGSVFAGTLGAIVTDAFDPAILYGLSNWHVLCHDLGRGTGDPIVQPEPIFGVQPGDQVGTLHAWAFPEATAEGNVDAAICVFDEGMAASLREVADIGFTSGTIAATRGMQVTKRGRTTGQTFGIVSGTDGSFSVDFPNLPAVTGADGNDTTERIFHNQIHIQIDFPSSIVFGEEGDSGSVVVGPNNQVVGLYWGSGFDKDEPGNPLKWGLANTATGVEIALGITF